MSVQILIGDCRDKLRDLPDASVHCCVTSPPYFGLRDYGVAGQMGLEPTPDEFVAGMVEVFREVRRVLRDDGTLWLNIGDSYASGRGESQGFDPKQGARRFGKRPQDGKLEGLKNKDLIGIPWALAQALRAPYYTGRIKSELDRVWLAAMMDGEGSISGFVHERSDGAGTRTGVNVCLTNTCEKILAKAAEIWPACLVPHAMNNDRLGNRPVYRWKPNGAENIGDFLAELYPYLLTKKAQAALAWNLMQFSKDGQAWGKSAIAGEIRDKRTLLAGMISELNKGGSPVIPDWVKEPPSLYEPGWYLRQEIIWHKPNPMPESVRDRCTKAHEQIFLLSKSPRYFFDADAIAESSITNDLRRPYGSEGSWQLDGRPTEQRHGGQMRKRNDRFGGNKHNGETTKHSDGSIFTGSESRNKRSVWTVTTQPYSEAHFATYPPALIEPCILAGCPSKCCAKCGAPWARRSEVVGSREVEVYTGQATKDYAAANAQNPSDTKRRILESMSQVKESRFEPSCGCDAGTVAGTCLDPFGGAGTTGLVADRLGRNAILIELNPEYAEIARKRLSQDAGMFAEVMAA